MDTANPSSLPLETKYQKLALEYTKLRSQASVLKKAFLAEQSKNSSLRETLRQKETQMRKIEQELDSLNFRNKQMERRIIALQEDFSKESNKKQSGKEKVKSVQNSNEPDPLLFEELQKKIIENAQLTSVIDDKNRELDIQSGRMDELEKKLEQQRVDHSDLEKKLRKEIDNLLSRNSEMETKLVDAGSILGSEDTLSVAGSETNHATTHHTPEERISNLEKDVVHWRTQYELLKMKTSAKPRPSDNSISSNSNATWSSSSCSTAATGISVTPCDTNHRHCSEPTVSDEDLSNEQVLFNKFSNTFEKLLKEKCISESKATSFQQECEGLQLYLEQYKSDVESKELELRNAGRNIQILEEDLTTTRLNYEEQISVLTEQVINLSDQLAASK